MDIDNISRVRKNVENLKEYNSEILDRLLKIYSYLILF